MVSPKIKRELQLFLYVFSSKFIVLWETKHFLGNLFVNSDLLVFKRFSFNSFLKTSHRFFSNLLILEDQEVNDCQFKKYFSRFLGVLKRTYLSNQKVLTSPQKGFRAKKEEGQRQTLFREKEGRSVLKSYFEFQLFLLSVKTVFLEPKKFGELMGLEKGEKRSDLIREVMQFFKLGENYFGIEEEDLFLIGRLTKSSSRKPPRRKSRTLSTK